MTFTQIDDVLMDSPGMVEATRSARLLLMEGYAYCNRHLTDGLITESQWRRATDTDDFLDELAQLEAGDLITRTASGWQLDWSKQQSREQVMKARERRRADNERRAKSLELHKAGDHSLCTHEGGGRSRAALAVASAPADKPGSRGPSDGRPDGRSTGTSTGRSSGHAPRKSKTSAGSSSGPSTDTSMDASTGPSSGPPVVGSPTHPIPSHPIPVVERRGGGDGDGGPAGPPTTSAGAPVSGSPGPLTRTMPDGFVVSADMLGGVDPNSLDRADLADLIYDRIAEGYIDADGRILERA